MIGKVVSHYRVRRQLGAGGMGIVYLADDLRLKRPVALKFLPPATVDQVLARSRFEREAETASALDHPAIATIFEIAEWEEQPFIAMAYYEGETLQQALSQERFSLFDVLLIGSQIAAGVAAAHAAGVVHRDLKPANIMLVRGRQVKILDFGLAKLMAPDAPTATRLTAAGSLMGTAAYMAPEVISGAEANQRADVWALGAILYEMLAGRPAFAHSHPAALMAAIVSDEPEPLGNRRPDAPPALSQLVAEMLAKDPERRSIAALDVASRLEAIRSPRPESESTPAVASAWSRLMRPRVAIPAAVLLLAGVTTSAWGIVHQRQRQWARDEAVPQISRLVEEQNYFDAFRLAQDAARYIPEDSSLEGLWPKLSLLVRIRTTPSDAKIRIKPYGADDRQAIELSEPTTSEVRIPQGLLHWRVERPGFVTLEDVGPIGPGEIRFTLDAAAAAPEGMVRVSAADQPFTVFIPGLNHLPPVTLPDYWIDRFEVTNGEFSRFVEAGGYEQRQYWSQEFVKGPSTVVMG